MDEIDRANAAAEQMLEARLSARKPAGPKPTGECAFCGDPAPEGAAFCSADCRDLWQRQQDARRRNGR